jgi:hypothetical protein
LGTKYVFGVPQLSMEGGPSRGVGDYYSISFTVAANLIPLANLQSKAQISPLPKSLQYLRSVHIVFVKASI